MSKKDHKVCFLGRSKFFKIWNSYRLCYLISQPIEDELHPIIKIKEQAYRHHGQGITRNLAGSRQGEDKEKLSQSLKKQCCLGPEPGHTSILTPMSLSAFSILQVG